MCLLEVKTCFSKEQELLASLVSLLSIDHIHNNRHVGFDIIMQISHVVCQGANIKMMLFLRKSAGLNSEVFAPKSHLRAKMWYNDFIIKVSWNSFSITWLVNYGSRFLFIKAPILRKTKNIFFTTILKQSISYKKLSYIIRNQAKFVDKSLFAP